MEEITQETLEQMQEDFGDRCGLRYMEDGSCIVEIQPEIQTDYRTPISNIIKTYKHTPDRVGKVTVIVPKPAKKKNIFSKSA